MVASQLYQPNMDPNDYLSTVFPDFLVPGHYDNYSDGYHRQANRAISIFDPWMAGRFADHPITIDHLSCYMIYRVIGEEITGGDEHNGSSSMTSFRSSEIGPLVNRLRAQGRVAFTSHDVTTDLNFLGRWASVMKMLGDVMIHTHARPLYLADERLLRAAFTMDTASLRDEAMIVLLRACGSRSASCAGVRLDLHIDEMPDGVIEVIVPSVKRKDYPVHRVPLLGDDAVVFRRWVTRRKQIHSSQPYLFITNTDEPVDTNDITQMLYKLGECAGYGPKFFSSHSFRSGFANRKAATVYARGGSQQEVVQQLVGSRVEGRPFIPGPQYPELFR